MNLNCFDTLVGSRPKNPFIEHPIRASFDQLGFLDHLPRNRLYLLASESLTLLNLFNVFITTDQVQRLGDLSVELYKFLA